MTNHQLQLLDFIREFIAKHGVSPTYREMKSGLGCRSLGIVHGMVNRLVDAGCLVRRPGRPRNLALPGADLRFVPTDQLRAELARRERRHA